jgi:hypothetical protein
MSERGALGVSWMNNFDSPRAGRIKLAARQPISFTFLALIKLLNIQRICPISIISASQMITARSGKIVSIYIPLSDYALSSEKMMVAEFRQA